MSLVLTLMLLQQCPGTEFGVDNGSLTVASGSVRINEAYALTQTIQSGEVIVSLEASPQLSVLVEGALVLLHQTRVVTDAGVGAVSPVDATAVGVGHFTFAQVRKRVGQLVTLREPVPRTFTAPGAQLIFVPRYERATIAPGASVVAPAWNGSSGGVMALVVAGPLLLSGALDARGRGFRGGGVAHAEMDGGVCDDSAFHGESFAVTTSSRSAAPVMNGGAGARCSDNGGGGGGNIGEGGPGGLADFSPPAIAPARGGAGVTSKPGLLFVGGAGGGAFGDLASQLATPGANGGGVIIVRAQSIAGAGQVRVDGEGAAASYSNGSGGGGAAGSMLIELSGVLHCDQLSARGGAGGDAPDIHGVGGGGAGGIVVVRAQVESCPIDVSPGLAGVFPNGTRSMGAASGGPTTLNDPRSLGEVFVNGGGECLTLPSAQPGQLSIRSPVEGELLVGRDLCFDGTASAATVSGTVDGLVLDAVPVQATQQWRLCIDGLKVGTHELVVQSFDQSGLRLAQTSVHFSSRGQALAVGCSCTTLDAGGLWALLACVLFSARRCRSSRLTNPTFPGSP